MQLTETAKRRIEKVIALTDSPVEGEAQAARNKALALLAPFELTIEQFRQQFMAQPRPAPQPAPSQTGFLSRWEAKRRQAAIRKALHSQRLQIMEDLEREKRKRIRANTMISNLWKSINTQEQTIRRSRRRTERLEDQFLQIYEQLEQMKD